MKRKNSDHRGHLLNTKISDESIFQLFFIAFKDFENFILDRLIDAVV